MHHLDGQHGHEVAPSTVLLISCKGFLDLIEEYLVMELFDDHFATHEDYEELPKKPTPLADCGHDSSVFVMLLSWLASTLRPAWCTLPRECATRKSIYAG